MKSEMLDDEDPDEVTYENATISVRRECRTVSAFIDRLIERNPGVSDQFCEAVRQAEQVVISSILREVELHLNERAEDEGETL